MLKKIFITGPSGVGKTTLAKYIAQRFDIPFVDTSAKNLWPSYGFKDHQHAHIVSATEPEIGLDYQLALLNHRIKALLVHEEFVCDRSPIDNFVYFMLETSPYVTSEHTGKFIEKCRAAMDLGNHLIIIPYTDEIRLDDGYRIQNHYYHLMVEQLERWALWDNKMAISKIDKVLTLNHWDFNLRQKLVEEWLR